jgi:PAS domain S-box-containing protein
MSSAGDVHREPPPGRDGDLLDERGSEQEPRQTRALLDAILSSFPAAVWVKDAREFRYQRVNATYEALFGYAEEDVLGRDDFEVFPANAEAFRVGDREVLSRGRIEIPVEPAEAPDGRTVWLRTTKVAVRDEDGTPLCVLGYAEDLTELRVAEAERAGIEALLDSIVRSLPGALWVKDAREFRYVRVNRTFEELIGYREPEVLGRDDYELFPAQAATFRDEDTRALAQGQVDIAAHPVTAADGSRLWLHTIKVGIRDADGTPWYVLGYAEDVTESHVAGEALRESEERFRSLLANLPGAVYRCRNDGIWTMEFVSQGIEDIVGYASSEFEGNAEREFVNVIHPDDRQHVEDTISHAVERRQPFVVEYRVLHADGSTRWVRENGRGAIDPDGRVRLLDGLILDVDDRKRAEAERDRMEVDLRLAHKLEAVGQLAAGIAHEINTPVQFVGDTVSFVKDAVEDLLRLVGCYRDVCGAAAGGPVDPAMLEQVAAMEREIDLEYLEERLPKSFERAFDGIDRVTKIVKGMKGFARVDQREPEPADLNQAIRDTVVVARNEWKYVADLELDLGELPPVVCHVGDLNQVFLNLIVNAAHAIEETRQEGDPLGTIRIKTATRDDGAVTITLADTGPGIPEAIRGRVFDPFFTTKEVGKGTGQGLAMARSIVDRHGGSLSFESKTGHGTVFTITLPVGGLAGVEERCAA